MMDKMALQHAEFDAADRFVAAHRAHGMTAIVDDDYGRVRHQYEGALAGLLKAMQANGAFAMGNRYGLQPVAAEHQPQPDADEIVCKMPPRGVVLWPVGYGNTVSALVTEPLGILFRALTDEQQEHITEGVPLELVALGIDNDAPGLLLQFADATAISDTVRRLGVLAEQADDADAFMDEVVSVTAKGEQTPSG